MTLVDAARLLGISPGALRHQIANKALRAVKRGRDWWVTPAEIERYRREHLGRPGRPAASR